MTDVTIGGMTNAGRSLAVDDKIEIETVGGAGRNLTGQQIIDGVIANTSSFLQKTNNLSDVANATTARTNLGLGTAATQSTSAFLQPANNLSDVSNASTARTNLGLGTAATQNTTLFLQKSNNLSDVASVSSARTNLGLGTAATQSSAAFLAAANNLADLPSTATSRSNLGLYRIITESTSARTLTSTDGGAIIMTTNASSNCTITIPSSATAIPVGSVITVVNQQTVGLFTTVSVTAGVTLIGTAPAGSNGSVFQLQKLSGSLWMVILDYEVTPMELDFVFDVTAVFNQTITFIKNQGVITLNIPSFTIANGSPGTSFIHGNATIPSNLIPSQSRAIPCFITVDGTDAPFAFSINTSGNLIWKNQNNTSFTATTVTTYPVTMTYMI